jgi:hypothetical protein
LSYGGIYDIVQIIDPAILTLLKTDISVVLFPIITGPYSESDGIFYELLYFRLSILSQLQEKRQG